MTTEVFEQRLSEATTPEILAKLASDIMEKSFDIDVFNEEDAQRLYGQFKILIDKDLDPTIEVDDYSVMSFLEYGYADCHLDIAKLIFEKLGMPIVKDFDDEYRPFYKWIRTKVDYDEYSSEYSVKLYLLCLAYCPPEEYIHFSENLYKEMFEDNMNYVSYHNVSEESKPLKLTQEIFKDIHRFDYTIEMLRQEEGKYGCWRLHIFDKKTKIEVATYY